MKEERGDELVLPAELVAWFYKKPKFKTAFEALTPDRKKAYSLFFSGTAESENRTRRIERYKNKIMDGFGLNDCDCGLSKNMPSCDGSHKMG